MKTEQADPMQARHTITAGGALREPADTTRPLDRTTLLRATRELCARDADLDRAVARFGPPPLWARPDRLCNARAHHSRAAGFPRLRGSHVRSTARCGRTGVVCSNRPTFDGRAAPSRIHPTEGGLLSGPRTADRERRTTPAADREIRRRGGAARPDPGSRNRPLDRGHLSADGAAASGCVARGRPRARQRGATPQTAARAAGARPPPAHCRRLAAVAAVPP